MLTTQQVDTCDIVVFGGTGDLAMRKLIPSLYQRDRDGQLTSDSRIIAVSRAGLDGPGYRDKVAAELPHFLPKDTYDSETVDAFLTRLHHVTLDVTSAEPWEELAALLTAVEDRVRVYYLASAPKLFGGICHRLQDNGLVSPQSRVVLEKPIGTDLASAQQINDEVGAVFSEEQIFRIDHYLGKETVQNLLVLRFANTLLEPMWRSAAIDHVQITVSETVGVGNRIGYYDGSGALRDMVQNHMLQLLCLVAMEPPNHYDRDSVRDEKLKVLQALKPLTGHNVHRNTVRGQYAPGSIDGQSVPGYSEELEGQASNTETYVALKAEVNSWRWAGVPFYLRTGKRLDRRASEIVVQFKSVPHSIFPAIDDEMIPPNRLVIRLQPDEAVRLHLVTKAPGPGGLRLREVPLNLSFAETFDERLPDAYERLLMDVVRGNPMLFMRRDEVEAAWEWAEPILTAWQESQHLPKRYASGSHGPAAATALIERDGRTWNDEE
ncbi:glucose-6-phosphate dehydrogenase [Hoyosella subflava]|uniref:Glucose-6-phosphate 1-dehydrogenase n=1 Tax=Hoyosella subflava (strain DSM 45089 / JCM 17490 / NBRC 109087 / DQS3-9A1) TaxID=443218 RepID=F6EEY9_HOYSD|nr:glucose-6-phosphate dehydrogenase [Hoyosella subflava]AEF42126.1 Glucose-6-phosphate 1-dehydrogenase [Hoyosella subflava DQS3-9A1]